MYDINDWSDELTEVMNASFTAGGVIAPPGISIL
jgi:hypothetical protein